MHEYEKPLSAKEESSRNQNDSLSQEAWNPRSCVYTDEMNNIVAGWKNSNNISTFERIVRNDLAFDKQSETTKFQGNDGKLYQVTEFNSDQIVRSDVLLGIKQMGGQISHSSQLHTALREYLDFKDQIENGPLCSEQSTGDNLQNGFVKLPNGDTLEETAGTKITRTSDGMKVTVQAVENGKELGRAEYTLAKDKEGNTVCILRTKFPDGYGSQSELSAEDFYAIRDSKGQTWKWLGNQKNHKFYIQGKE